ncbi:MAG TPA: aminoacyl-tRNA hydrolase [Epulopiscium sp.]|nr:aminoacyl-tRNA hydrolase [Candidatus Epulonipiscium sp.]
MKLIIGLGNPGKEYTKTRHNIGFEAVDALADNYNININKSKFKALYGEGKVGNEKVVLVKPQTYMNLSGESVKAFATWYKIKEKDILIIYDDVSLPPGKLRIRIKGSAGGHNGIKSIIQHLGTNEFERLKVGIGEKPQGWNLADYVLSRFTNAELKSIEQTMEDIVGATTLIIEKGIQDAMNKYNPKARG